MEDLLELMYHCMFVSPVTSLQSVISELVPSFLTESTGESQKHVATIPFLVDSEHFSSVSWSSEQDGGLMASFDCSEPGYFIGLTPMTAGKYTWKVSSLAGN